MKEQTKSKKLFAIYSIHSCFPDDLNFIHADEKEESIKIIHEKWTKEEEEGENKGKYFFTTKYVIIEMVAKENENE